MPNRRDEKEVRRESARARLTLRAAAALLLAAAELFSASAAAAQKRPAAPKASANSKAPAQKAAARATVPVETLLQIIEAEDERHWDATEFAKLFGDANPSVRARAALAAGRIGDEGAVGALGGLLNGDRDERVRAAAAFALGEIEAESASAALQETLARSKSPELRARAVEALGKICAALPDSRQDAKKRIGEVIVNALAAQSRQPKPDRLLVLLGLTAVLRAKPDGGARTVALFLASKDARVRGDAANTLARLRAKESLERLRAMLSSDSDAVARANAARVLGVAEDKAAFDALAARVSADPDSRVRVSAVRSLASLKDARAGQPLRERAEELHASYRAEKSGGADAKTPSAVNELLEIFTALGVVLANTNDERAVSLLRSYRSEGLVAPQLETALARIAPAQYMRDPAVSDLFRRVPSFKDPSVTWQKVSAMGQGLGEMSGVTSAQVGNSVVSLQADAQIALRSLVTSPNTPALAVPDLLRALASFKPMDMASVAREQLKAEDVIVRATAADILSELPPDADTARALVAALPRALEDEINDAALSVLGALAKQQGGDVNNALKSALSTADYLVRRRAADILRERAGGAAAEARRVETVNTRNHRSDYERAAARAAKQVRALVATDKGSFTIELLAEDAPLTVDNFVTLARRGYFNNVTFHRVVPNFVIQGGDPRGDGNGGPGYQIRDEINTVPYDRGAVGMALSGRDTGGSQWFVTHSPQPHLDGGYTVFGRVVTGMDVVDRISRGDRIRSVTVTETRKGP